MSVLTSAEIQRAVDSENLIDPWSSENMKGCSYDLTIGTVFRDGVIINEESSGPSKQFVVPPGGVISMLTRERLKLPLNMLGTAFPINAMSSRGFLVLNPGHVDPGFSGALSVRAINLRKTDLALNLGEPVFTIIFQRLAEQTAPYTKNIPHKERERNANSQDVEHSPQTLSRLIQLDREGPYPIRSEVSEMISQQVVSLPQIKEEIRTHAVTRVTLYAVLTAAALGLITVVHQLWYSNDPSRSVVCPNVVAEVASQAHTRSPSVICFRALPKEHQSGKKW